MVLCVELYIANYIKTPTENYLGCLLESRDGNENDPPIT